VGKEYFWTPEGLAERRQLFTAEGMCQWCDNVCPPFPTASEDDYRMGIYFLDLWLTKTLNKGITVTPEGLYRVVLWNIVCLGFPQHMITHWYLDTCLKGGEHWDWQSRIGDSVPKGRTWQEVMSIALDFPDVPIEKWIAGGELPSPEEVIRIAERTEVSRDDQPLHNLQKRLMKLILSHVEQGSKQSVGKRREIHSEENTVESIDSHSLDAENYTDMRLYLDQIIAESPTEQARAGRLFLKSQQEAKSFRETCMEENVDPNKSKANLQRFLDRIKTDLIR